ncbi:hypothetical protein PMAYCL1PPCAC_05871, partial [Pristionchus mayeri]
RMTFHKVNIISLNDLPSDIIRKVIRAGRESIDNQRLVSHRWNTLVTEFMNDRSYLPVVEWIKFDSSSRSISMRIPNQFTQYFGFKIDSNSANSYFFSRPISSVSETIAHFSRRCSKIHFLELTLNGDTIDDNRLISNALGKVLIEESTGIPLHSNSSSGSSCAEYDFMLLLH